MALTALGLLLRRYRLGANGLWFDEADLVIRASQPLPDLLAAFVQPGENGPLYTLLLAGWLRLAGDGEIAVRLPSVIAGTLAIPALALLGHALGGWRVGLTAAGLLAISPYAIWYSQDAKMYALLTLLMPLTWWLLLLALRRDRTGWWVAYAALTAAGFAVHLFSVFVWLSQTLVVLLQRRRLGAARRPWRRVTLILLLPQLVAGLWHARLLASEARFDAWQPAASLPEMLSVLAVKLAVNRADPATETWGAWMFAALAALGLLAWLRGWISQPDAAPANAMALPSPATYHSSHSQHSRLTTRNSALATRPLPPAPSLLLTALVVPVLAFFLITLRVPLFQDRYLIVILPAYLLLVAGAFVWLARRLWPLALVSLAALLVLAWVPLRDVVYAADAQKEDWVSAYRFIDAHAREGDVVVIHPGYLRTTAEYYARRFDDLRRLPIVSLPSLRDEIYGERDLDSLLADATWGKTRVWLITSPDRLAGDDPRGLLRRWYEGNTLRFADRLFNGVRVETFSYNGPMKSGLWQPELPFAVAFGDAVTLVGATWDLPGVEHTVPVGDWALLTLRWMPQRPLTTAYVVRVRLRDAAGREVAQYDIQPLDGHYPTDRWRAQAQVWDYHDLFLQPDLPPGRYEVIVGLYPAGQPDAGLRPTTGAAPGDPLGMSVGTLNVVR